MSLPRLTVSMLRKLVAMSHRRGTISTAACQHVHKSAEADLRWSTMLGYRVSKRIHVRLKKYFETPSAKPQATLCYR
eukprot:6426705-Amphidinium_carterae.1